MKREDSATTLMEQQEVASPTWFIALQKTREKGKLHKTFLSTTTTTHRQMYTPESSGLQPTMSSVTRPKSRPVVVREPRTR